MNATEYAALALLALLAVVACAVILGEVLGEEPEAEMDAWAEMLEEIAQMKKEATQCLTP